MGTIEGWETGRSSIVPRELSYEAPPSEGRGAIECYCKGDVVAVRLSLPDSQETKTNLISNTPCYFNHFLLR